MTPAQDVDIAERDDLQVTVAIEGLEEGARLTGYPDLFWKEGDTPVDYPPAGAARVVMQPVADKTKDRNVYVHTFAGVRRDFAFRVLAQDGYSRSTQVHVRPAPRIAEGQFHLTPPAYVGGKTTTHMGPPHPLSALPGSSLQIDIKLDQSAKSLRWRFAGQILDFHYLDERWHAQTTIQTAGAYQIEVEPSGEWRVASGESDDHSALTTRHSPLITIGEGVLTLLADRPPQIEFVESAMSFTVVPGERVPLRLRAEDDYGLKEMSVAVRSAYDQGTSKVVKSWNFGGAPGRKGRVEETMDLSIDASLFAPGGKYFVEASCSDFCPTNPASVSRPVLIEVKSLEKLTMPDNPKLADLYTALDKAIAFQKKALDATRTFTSSIDEVWLDMSGQPRTETELHKLQDAHREKILGNQREVRALLLGVSDPPGTLAVSRITKRLHELGEGEARQANDRSFALTQAKVDITNAKPMRNDSPLAATTNTQKIAFSPTRARYVGLVVRSTHGWQDAMEIQNVTVTDFDDPSKSGQWSVVSEQPAPAAGHSALTTGGENKRWQTIGRLPYTVVIDLGGPRILDGLSFAAAAFKGSLGPRDMQVYLGADNPIQLELHGQTKKDLSLELRLLERVQEAIYNELVALKGQEALKAEKNLALQAKKVLGETIESPPTVKEEVKKFLDELKDWTREQENGSEKRKSITDKPPQDFSEKDQEDLVQSTLEKRKLARRLDDMVEELSNAAAMDFGDSSMAKTLPKLLDKANDLKDLSDLAAYKAEMFDYSYNLDNAMISQAKEIAKGTEDTTHVDPTPGSTESPEDKKAPVFLQEIPSELAVTVPKLTQDLENYYEKIKQAGTSLANSVEDSDGPIQPSGFSGTSAAGKMGDATPDKKADRTGRSNVGRTGKSDGQMVGSTAPPIPDEQILIPERMSNSPQEGNGRVDDKSGNQATSQGLGKGTNGLTEFGRSGKLPPGMEKNLKTIQRQSEDLRSSAHELVLKLQRHSLPSADLKMALHRLEQMDQALAKGNGVGIRQAYSEAVNSLQAATKSLTTELALRKIERAQTTAQRPSDQSGTDIDADPRGYEDIIGAYFRQLAEKK